MGYHISKNLNIGQFSIFKYDVPYGLTYTAPLCFTEIDLNLKHAMSKDDTFKMRYVPVLKTVHS